MTNQLPEKGKGRKAVKYRGAKCLNCSTPLDLSDVHCSYCGQLNTTKSLSLKDFFGEFIGSLITYDSKLRYTLKDLLLRPGVITRNFVQGQRLKYANPFRFFLSVSIIYFILNSLIMSLTGENSLFNFNSSQEKQEASFGPTGDNIKIFTTPGDTTHVDSAKIKEALFLESQAKKYGYPSQKEIDSLIKEAVTKKKKKEEEGPSFEYISEDSLQQGDWANSFIKRVILYNDFYETTEIKNPKKALDSLQHANTKWNRWTYQKVEVIQQVKENPSEFFTYLMEKTPFFVFFFTPFYAFFFWLIYSKSKYTYMEHMIFIFHIFSFVFLGMIIALIPDTILNTEVFYGLLFGIIGPFYFYKALRNFYKQNRLITIIKFIFLNFVFVLSASFSALLFFAVTAALY